MNEHVSKPWITANQVTLIRLIPIPFLAWCFYQSTTFHWIGLILGTLIGCTDWVDGLLARKYGPTQLGALLDPMVDKIFIAMVYLPMADIGKIQLLPVILMFVREFLITALRTAFKARKIEFKTSYLAKVKTWVQMQNIAIVLLLILLPKEIMIVGCIAGALISAVVAITYQVIRKRIYKGAWIMAFAFALLVAIVYFFSKEATISITIWSVVAVTWISGFDYLVKGIPKILKSGKLQSFEHARIIGAIAIPVICGLSLYHSNSFPWPVFAIVSLELSLGGLDNLYAHHNDAASAKSWLLRILGISVFLILSMMLPERFVPIWSTAAFLFSLLGFCLEAARGKRHYL